MREKTPERGSTYAETVLKTRCFLYAASQQHEARARCEARKKKTSGHAQPPGASSMRGDECGAVLPPQSAELSPGAAMPPAREAER